MAKRQRKPRPPNSRPSASRPSASRTSKSRKTAPVAPSNASNRGAKGRTPPPSPKTLRRVEAARSPASAGSGMGPPNMPPVVGVGASAGGLAALRSLLTPVPAGGGPCGLAFIIVMHLDPRHGSAMTELLARITILRVGEAQNGAEIEPGHVYVIQPNTAIEVRDGRLWVTTGPGKGGGPGGLLATAELVDRLLVSLALDQGPNCAAVIMSGMGHDGTEGARAVGQAGGLVLVQTPESAQASSMPESAIAGDDPDRILPPEKMVEVLLEHFCARQGRRLSREERASIASAPGTIGTDEHASGERSEHNGVVEDDESATDPSVPELEAPGDIAPIHEQLRIRTGYDFSRYKRGTIVRRVQRRMAQRRLSTYAEYARVLRAEPEEARTLFRDVLVGVTEFFRDPESWEALRTLVIDPLVSGQTMGGEHSDNGTAPIRIWVPGCASGQEAYTIAMLLTERLEALSGGGGRRRDIKIFATDINDAALEIARAGVFTSESVAKMLPSRVERFFTREESGGVRVAKSIRSLIIFAQQSLIADPPFSRLHLITCRNVLIYLDTELQRRVIGLFCHALRPGGTLFLGNTESIGPYDDVLRPISKKWRIFQRYGSPRRPIGVDMEPSEPRFYPPSLAVGREGAAFMGTPAGTSMPRLAALAQRLVLEHFSPASVLVNENGRVLYFCGPTEEYLTQPTGEPTSDLMEMARPSLRGKLRSAMQRALRDLRPVVVSNVPLGPPPQADASHSNRGKGASPKGKSRLISIKVTPIRDGRAAQNASKQASGRAGAKGGGRGSTSESVGGPHAGIPSLLLVVFEDQGSATRRQKRDRDLSIEEGTAVHRLEQDLRLARDDLQVQAEEADTSHEELKAANEELMSMNEELQSSGEELETSKEELQSLNEELTTVNNQLHTKVEELEATNNDLENLLASTDLATIFLDREFKIRRFTPAVRRLVSLMPADIGRPITDFAQRFSDERLLSDAQEVLRTLLPEQAEIKGTDGRVYLRRIVPYRTGEDYIDGVVATFTDITERERATERQARLAAIVESSEDAIFSIDLAGNVTSWNGGAERMFGYVAPEIMGKPAAILIPEDQRPERERILRELTRGEGLHVEAMVHVAKDGRRVPISLTASPMRDQTGAMIGFSNICRDITERQEAQVRQQMLMAELDHRVKNTLAVVLSLASQTLEQSRSLEEFSEAFQGRLVALSSAHNLLSERSWKGGSLEELVTRILSPMQGERGFNLQGEEVLVPPRAAVPLAMVFHELSTNAAKHGAFSTPKGHVEVSWTAQRQRDEVLVECDWLEIDGPRTDKPGREGFGSRLIRLCIENELGGRFSCEYRPEGFRCRFSAKWTLPTQDCIGKHDVRAPTAAHAAR